LERLPRILSLTFSTTFSSYDTRIIILNRIHASYTYQIHSSFLGYKIETLVDVILLTCARRLVTVATRRLVAAAIGISSTRIIATWLVRRFIGIGRLAVPVAARRLGVTIVRISGARTISAGFVRGVV
jgi:hypothetical protein